jgi:hypothetical protein
VTTKTHQEQFEAAMQCSTKEEADEWMSDEIQYYLDNFPEVAGPDEAATTIMANLGYMAGYYGQEAQQQKIYDLFGATHPVFGTPVKPWPTPDEAFKKGYELGEYMRTHKKLPANLAEFGEKVRP